MKPSELQSLIQKLIDGEISAEEFSALDDELARSAEARETYRLFTGLHSGLVRRGEIDAAIHSGPVVPIDRVMALQRRRVARISLLASAAAIVLTGLALWMTMTPETPSVFASVKTTPGSVFTLTHADGAKSSTGTLIHPGSTVRLDHGVAEFDLPHRVRAVLEAPTTMTLVDERTVQLGRGRGFFEVASAEGHGFTVETPDQRIVDLGTAFGVEVSNSTGHAYLYIVEGSVRIDALDGQPGPTLNAPRSVGLLGASVDNEIVDSPVEFARSLPPKVETVFVEDFESGLLANRDYSVIIDRNAVRDLDGNRFAGIPEKNPWKFSTALPTPASIEVVSYAYDGGHPPSDQPSAHQPSGSPAGLFLDPLNSKLTDGNPGASSGWKSGSYVGFGDNGDISDPQITFDLGEARPIDEISCSVYENLPHAVAVSASMDGEVFSVPVQIDWEQTQGNPTTLRLDVSTWSPARFWRLKFSHPTQWMFLGEVTFAAPPPVAIGDPPHLVPDRAEPTPDKSALAIVSLNPPLNSSSSGSLGQLVLHFNQPVRFGTGRVIVRTVGGGNPSEIVIGSQRTSIHESDLFVAPPMDLPDGAKAIGYPAAWQSPLPVVFHNPSGTGESYRGDEFADNEPARGEPGAMKGPSLLSLSGAHHRHPIRRKVGTIALGHRYTVSLGIGNRGGSGRDHFLGYDIRIISGGTVLARLTGDSPPGPPGTVTDVGLSCDSASLPEGVTPGDTIEVQIAPLAPIPPGPGYLDIDHLKLTRVGR